MQLGHKDGKLQVFYSDRLVTLLREVRQLTALGFVVPAKIQHTASMANRFYRQAVILKQVLWRVCYILRDLKCTVLPEILILLINTQDLSMLAEFNFGGDVKVGGDGIVL